MFVRRDRSRQHRVPREGWRPAYHQRMHIRIGDGTGNEDYRTCAECGCDCEPEIIDGGEGVGIRVALSCAEHGLHGVTDPFEGMR